MKLLASLNVSLVFAGTIAFAFGILPVAARGQTSQEVRLEVSQLLFGSGPTFLNSCLLYTSPSPRDQRGSRMPSSA